MRQQMPHDPDREAQKFQLLWLSIARKDIIRAQRAMKNGNLAAVANARTLARACQKKFNQEVTKIKGKKKKQTAGEGCDGLAYVF
jgi:hypothetical protein